MRQVVLSRSRMTFLDRSQKIKWRSSSKPVYSPIRVYKAALINRVTLVPPKLSNPTARPPRTTAKWSHERKVRLEGGQSSGKDEEKLRCRRWGLRFTPGGVEERRRLTRWQRILWAQRGWGERCAVGLISWLSFDADADVRGTTGS